MLFYYGSWVGPPGQERRAAAMGRQCKLNDRQS